MLFCGINIIILFYYFVVLFICIEYPEMLSCHGSIYTGLLLICLICLTSVSFSLIFIVISSSTFMIFTLVTACACAMTERGDLGVCVCVLLHC